MTDKDWGDMSVTDVKKVSIPPCLAPSEIELNTTLIGDCRETLKQLPDGCINACITSPPYWGLRDYGTAEQLGLESTPEEYVKKMVAVFSEVRRTLRDDGTLWLNVGDSYSSHTLGLKNKDLVGIPWMLAFALRADGWYLRQDIIWHKPNPMPEPVTDRCTKAHEYIFLMSKKSKYFFDNEAIRVPYTEPINRWGGEKLEAKGHSIWDEGTGHKTYRDRNIRPNPEGKNKRSVWTVPTHSYKGAHFATFPPKLITPCILAGTSDKGCCADCGSPYERIIEKDRQPTRTGKDTKTEGLPDTVIGNRDPLRHVTVTKTTGWEKTCKCETTEVEPCVVLDPFMGSGTTGMVAQSLGRSWIGCELNPEYVEMQMKRTSQQSLF